MDEQPQVLSINVADTVKTGESTSGVPPLEKIFQNPKGDPNIAGMCKVKDEESLKHLAPMAIEYSKQTKKPVLIIVLAQQ